MKRTALYGVLSVILLGWTSLCAAVANGASSPDAPENPDAPPLSAATGSKYQGGSTLVSTSVITSVYRTYFTVTPR